MESSSRVAELKQPLLDVEQAVPDVPVTGNGLFSDAELADYDGDGLNELAILWQQKTVFYDIAPDGTLSPRGHANACEGIPAAIGPGTEGGSRAGRPQAWPVTG